MALDCHFAETPNAQSATLPGLYLNGSHCPGFTGDRITVTGDIMLRKITSSGEFRLLGAKISGNLECDGAKFTNAGGNTIHADGAEIGGTVFLRDGFTAEGQVRLLGAKISRDLACSGGTFTNAGSNALSADRAEIGGGVFLRDRFTAKGEVRLLGAKISGNLDCSGGTFTNAGGDAISTDGAEIGGDVFLNDGFTAEGQVRLAGTKITSNLVCIGGTFNNPPGTAIAADSATIGSLFLRDAKVDGTIDLTDTHTGTLVDNERDENHQLKPHLAQCWKDGRHLLDGFRYDRIIGPCDAATRIAWLDRQEESQLTAQDWAPQPWEQLIHVLRDMGHPHEAAKVGIEKQRRMRRAGKIGKTPRWQTANGPWQALRNLGTYALGWASCAVKNTLHRLSGHLIGYGYARVRLLLWMLLLFPLAGWAYSIGYTQGYLGPTSAPIMLRYHDLCGAPGDHRPTALPATNPHQPRIHLAKLHWSEPACTPPEYTSFNPWLYSLDLILPVVNLAQDGDWSPLVADERGNTLWPGAALRWLMWFEILFGWVATLFLAAQMGGLIKRD